MQMPAQKPGESQDSQAILEALRAELGVESVRTSPGRQYLVINPGRGASRQGPLLTALLAFLAGRQLAGCHCDCSRTETFRCD